VLCENFIKIAIINNRTLAEINDMLVGFRMSSVTEADIVAVVAQLPSKYHASFMSLDLFAKPITVPPMITYSDLSWEEVMLIKDISDKMAEVIQLGILLKVNGFIDILKKRYIGCFEPYLLDLYKKYVFNVDRVSAVEFYQYVQDGKITGVTSHLVQALSNPSFAEFLVTGQSSDDLNMLVKNAGQVAYAKFMECFQTNNPAEAQKWAQVLIKAAQVKTPTKKNDLLDQLEQLSVEWDEKTNAHSEVPQMTEDIDDPDPLDDELPE